jgi:hypothetical protein
MDVVFILQSGPSMTGLPLEKQMLHHTPHPRNGYMFYNHDGTPTLADESVPGIKPRKSVPSTSTPCSQVNFGLGATPVSSRTVRNFVFDVFDI